MYNNKLISIIEPKIFKQCENYINTVKEAKHLNVVECHKVKFDRLWQRYQDCDKKAAQRRTILPKQVWPSKPIPGFKVNNITMKMGYQLIQYPLTSTSEALLAHEPNVAVAPQNTPMRNKLLQ